MRIVNRRKEAGVALLLSILALLLLSAIAVGMMYTSNTETLVSNNFRQEEAAYFAARSGVEEVRDRMFPGNPNTINGIGLVPGVCQPGKACLLPTVLPGAVPPPGNPAPVLYILQNGVTMANNVQRVADPSVDDELCHDFPYANVGYGGMTPTAPNVRCTAGGNLNQPAGNAWYTSPQPATAAPYAMDWKWVRVTLKANDSTSYLVNTVLGGATTPAASQLVCWNKTSEVTVPANTPVSPINNSPCGSLNPVANPVYLVTALAVSPNGGARRMVQQEVAEDPVAPQPAGLFATGTGCGALSLGGGAQTGSFNSTLGTPPVLNGGNVGANGNINISGNGTSVNGTVNTNQPATQGNCNQGNGLSGNGSFQNCQPANTPACTIPLYTPAVPPLPNPAPPTTNCNNPNPCWNVANSTLSPGSYGNVSLSGGTTITLQGGTVANPNVFTLNSLSICPGCNIVINGGPVILNIAGLSQNQTCGSPPCYMSTPVDINGFANNTNVAGDFVINYGGPGNINIASANAGAYAVVNAPNANVSLTGNASFYGQILGATVTDTGGAQFYWDTAANVPPPFPAPLYEISMRELSY